MTYPGSMSSGQQPSFPDPQYQQQSIAQQHQHRQQYQQQQGQYLPQGQQQHQPSHQAYGTGQPGLYYNSPQQHQFVGQPQQVSQSIQQHLPQQQQHHAHHQMSPIALAPDNGVARHHGGGNIFSGGVRQHQYGYDQVGQQHQQQQHHQHHQQHQQHQQQQQHMSQQQNIWMQQQQQQRMPQSPQAVNMNGAHHNQAMNLQHAQPFQNVGPQQQMAKVWGSPMQYPVQPQHQAAYRPQALSPQTSQHGLPSPSPAPRAIAPQSPQQQQQQQSQAQQHQMRQKTPQGYHPQAISSPQQQQASQRQPPQQFQYQPSPSHPSPQQQQQFLQNQQGISYQTQQAQNRSHTPLQAAQNLQMRPQGVTASPSPTVTPQANPVRQSQSQSPQVSSHQVPQQQRPPPKPPSNPPSKPPTLQQQKPPRPMDLQPAAEVKPQQVTLNQASPNQQLGQQSPQLFQPPPQPQPSQTVQFVSMADIQRMPVQLPMPSQPAPTPQSTQQTKEAHNMPPPATASPSLSKKTPLPSPKQGQMSSTMVSRSPSQASPRPSSLKSPAMSTSGITGKSPASKTKTLPDNNASMTIALAEEFIGQAREAVVTIARGLDPNEVEEYQTLIATGLACFDGAIQSQQLPPRHEARVRLRYATILQEETDNLMEAETTLNKGVISCDNHRMPDLKYSMQHMMMKVLYQRNPKAAIRALDQLIKDCTAYQHVHWAYAFRLLKSTFLMESGHSADPSALENLHAIQNIALQRGDAAVSVFASLMEALTLIKSSRGSQESIQNCLAAAAKHQLDQNAQIPQLKLMDGLIGVLTRLNRYPQEEAVKKLRSLQTDIDNTPPFTQEILLPIKRASASSLQTISADTGHVLRCGDPQGDVDYLVVSFMSHDEMALMVLVLGGLIYFLKSSSTKTQSSEFWRYGLERCDILSNPSPTTAMSLKQAIKHRDWAANIRSHLHILLGLLQSTECKWDAVKERIVAAEATCPPSMQEVMLKPYISYLKGAYCQGTGDFSQALAHYQDDSLFLAPDDPSPKYQQRHLALLAALNRIWIMQHPSHRDNDTTTTLLQDIEPLFKDYADLVVLGAFLCVRATIVIEPPRGRAQQKDDASKALFNTKKTWNTLSVTIALAVARALLYNNLLGDQPIKCVQAAIHWSERAGNPLWESVVSGIRFDVAQAQVEPEQAQKFFDKGLREAKAAMAWNS